MHTNNEIGMNVAFMQMLVRKVYEKYMILDEPSPPM